MAVLVIVTALGVVAFSLTSYRDYVGDIFRGISRSIALVTNPKISDHWKERVLPSYSLLIFASSIKLLLSLIALFTPFLFCYALFQSQGFDLAGEALSVSGLLIATLVASSTLYAITQARKNNDAGYSYWDRLLHWLALSSDSVGETFLDIELARHPVDPEEVRKGRHVFVTGLARGGTTILMRSLHGTGRFTSLTYLDMPFVLAPNSWKQLRGKTENCAAKERSHQDGILVDFESPEALEEIFWRTLDGGAYIRPDKMCNHAMGDALIDRYARYIGVVNKSGGEHRYLAKNNNHVLRLGPLLKGFPNADFLVPYRHPLQQANSLRRQHRLLSESQRKNPFFKRYMNWLAHHEFGCNKKRMSPTDYPFAFNDPESLEFWLEEWISVYGYVADLVDKHERITPVGYEIACSNSIDFWHSVTGLVSVETETTPVLAESSRDILYQGDKGLLNQALEIYQTLDRWSKQRLGL
jgi:hypothetical protein